MRNISRGLRKRTLCDEGGFALPLTLIILNVTAIFVFAGLWVSNALWQRVDMRIDALRARNLAHAGVALETSELLSGNDPSAVNYQNSDGSCQVTCVKTSSSTYTLNANAVTATGAHSTATVLVDLGTNKVTNWTQSP